MEGFDAYTAKREELLGIADTLESVWHRFHATRPPIEGALVSEVDSAADVVTTELSEARRRLSSSVIEVGIFGDIKRGKSTLMNALLGVEVSSMNVTPETAVPVWVESGLRSATVLFSDGQTLEVDPDEALVMASQRYGGGDGQDAAEEMDRSVARVVHRVESELLGPGIRLIDTPGLSDPSMSDVFEELTLSELDRVAAAIMVLVYPPGIARNEVELLESLDSRRVDKTFVVCNFFHGMWENEQARTQVEENVRRILDAHLPAGQSSRIYPVNAAMAWEAARDGDHERFVASGAAALLEDLKEHLSRGVLELLVLKAGRHLRTARAVARDRVNDRLELLENPSALSAAREDLREEIAAARRHAEAICSRLDDKAGEVIASLMEIVSEPFDEALADVETATKRRDLQLLHARWEVRHESMLSRFSQLFGERFASLESFAHDELLATLGIEMTERDGTRAEIERLEQLSGYLAPRDPGFDSGIALLAAGGGAAVGGAMAGGAGMALLAFMGPVGWAVGAGIGALLGGGAAGVLQSRLPAAARHELGDKIRAGRLAARRRAKEQVDAELGRLKSKVLELQEAHGVDAVAELDAIERFLADEQNLRLRIAECHALTAELDAVQV